MSRPRSTIFAISAFDGKYQNLQTSFFTFFIFTKVRPMLTKVTDTRTDTQTHNTETDKLRVVGEIYQICLKR